MISCDEQEKKMDSAHLAAKDQVVPIKQNAHELNESTKKAPVIESQTRA